ncbi:unnamed protein product [Adineta steineri]|uniref:Meckelin n=1 Tax=Adineta steineri TaxID=433720 RepID=A0A815AE69_9BILA|nr:unnamed protein product [Adineta steineri]CAF1543798.1 unnamed protein product [Adineta steineri]
MDIASQTLNVYIAVGVLSGLGFIIALIRTWKWFLRSGKEIVDLGTIAIFTFHLIGIIGTVILLVTAGASVWWLLIIKKQYENISYGDISSFENLIKFFLIISFVLKTIDIIHLIVRQTRIEIFFMDWERTKIDYHKISVWRTNFVANEFNEIQTYRRINVTLKLFFVLFFLKVVNLESLSCVNNEFTLSTSPTNCTEYNPIFRTGIGFITLSGTSIIQYLAFTLFYQRIIADKIINFIDLCSVSNISVFILDQYYHGYYIHGRSPHGKTDVNIKEIIMNLHREENQTIGTRGLQDNSDEQIFIMKINRNFRKQYELLFRNYYSYIGPRKTREDTERYTDMLLQSYQNLNGFLCAFIDHSLASYKYFIRNRYFLEKIFNYEFQARASTELDGITDNILYPDNEKTFTKTLFYGEESSLFIWNIVTFLFIDALASNYILATVITYILNSIFTGIRKSFGRRNLSRKTLIPRNFLI